MRVFWANPCGAENVLKGVVTTEVLLAEHEGEVKLLGVRGLFRAIVAVDVVVECLEWTFTNTSAVQLNANAFTVLRRPLGGLFDIFQIAVVFARKIEFVKNIRYGFKTDCAVGAQVDGCADFNGWKIAFDDGCDERRRRGDDVRKQPAVIHLRHDILHKILQLMADGLLAVAIAVEEGIQLDVVFSAPCEIGDEPFAKFRCEIGGRTAGKDPRPSEKDFTDAFCPRGARMDEVFI